MGTTHHSTYTYRGETWVIVAAESPKGKWKAIGPDGLVVWADTLKGVRTLIQAHTA